MKIVVAPKNLSPSRYKIAFTLAEKMSPFRKTMVISHWLGDLYFLKRLGNGVVFVFVQYQEVFQPESNFYNQSDSLTFGFAVPTGNNSVLSRDGRFSKMAVVDTSIPQTSFPPEPRGFRSANAYKDGEFSFVGSTHGGYVSPTQGGVFTNSIASNNFGVVTDSVAQNPMFDNQPTNTVTEVWDEGQIANTTVVVSGPSISTTIEIDQTTRYYLTASRNSKLGEGYGIAVQAHEYGFTAYEPGSTQLANGSRAHSLVTKNGVVDLNLNSSYSYSGVIAVGGGYSTQTRSGNEIDIIWSGYVDKDLLCIIPITVTYTGNVYDMHLKYDVLLFNKFEKIFEGTLVEGDFVANGGGVPNPANLPSFYTQTFLPSIGVKTLCGLDLSYVEASTGTNLKDVSRLKRDGNSFSIERSTIEASWFESVGLLDDVGEVKRNLVISESGLKKYVISDTGLPFTSTGFVYDSSGYLVETGLTDWYPSSILSKL